MKRQVVKTKNSYSTSVGVDTIGLHSKSHCLGKFCYVQKIGALNGHRNKLKGIIGTNGHWKNQNRGGRFGAAS